MKRFFFFFKQNVCLGWLPRELWCFVSSELSLGTFTSLLVSEGLFVCLFLLAKGHLWEIRSAQGATRASHPGLRLWTNFTPQLHSQFKNRCFLGVDDWVLLCHLSSYQVWLSRQWPHFKTGKTQDILKSFTQIFYLNLGENKKNFL